MGVTQRSSQPEIIQPAQARETYKQEDVGMLKQNGEKTHGGKDTILIIQY